MTNWLGPHPGLLWCCILFNSVFAAEGTPDFRAPGTEAMARLLDKIANEVDPGRSLFFSAERVRIFGPRVAAVQDPGQQLQVLPGFALDLLNAGRSEEALETFIKVEALGRRINPGFVDQHLRLLRTSQAIAHLRIGEQENCLTHHTTDSCILPIRPPGVHKLQRGSRGAIQTLEAGLNDFPGDLTMRWLLNIACMTVGEYPDKVPAKWLIPPSAFESEYDIGRFVDVAGQAGVDVNELSGGSLVEDFNADGLLDIMVSSIGLRDQMRLFINNGDGTFSERTREAGLTGEVGGLNLVQTDFNNDGFADVLVLRGAWFGSEGRHPKSLLRNNGNGTFSDVTAEAGLLTFHPSQTAVWFDYDGDGWLDLFVGNETTDPDINPCELFRNNGDGTFTECAEAAGLALVGFVKGVAAGDYNNDRRPDLYLSHRSAPNVLLRNDGPKDAAAGGRGGWRFTDVTAAAGVAEPLHSFPCWFWDYDNDGWLDLLVTGYFIRNAGDVAADVLGLSHEAERARLYRNNRDGTFADVTRETGLFKVLHAMGSNFGDLDNDGWLDFYVGTGDPDLSTLIPNRMFRNAGGRAFQDVTTSGGFGHLQKGHGVSFADLDNDGDQDVHEDMGGAFTGDVYRNVLFENPGHGNHWLKVRLVGVQSNRPGLGARIKITVRSGEAIREIHRTVTTGGSFGCNPFRQEIGLGDAAKVDSLTVHWPASGITQEFRNLQADRAYEIREDAKAPVTLALKAFKFPKGPATRNHEHHH